MARSSRWVLGCATLASLIQLPLSVLLLQTANSEFVIGADGVARSRNGNGDVIAVVDAAVKIDTLTSALPDSFWESLVSRLVSVACV